MILNFYYLTEVEALMTRNTTGFALEPSTSNYVIILCRLNFTKRHLH